MKKYELGLLVTESTAGPFARTDLLDHDDARRVPSHGVGAEAVFGLFERIQTTIVALTLRDPHVENQLATRCHSSKPSSSGDLAKKTQSRWEPCRC